MTALVLVGCSGSTRLHEFKTVASLGADYTRAVEGALVHTGQLAIRANSLEMLENRELTPISRGELERQDAALANLVSELALLRRQAVALHDYFAALAALAGSDAPSQYAAGLNESASSLAAVASSIGQGSGRFAEVGGRSMAAAAVGQVAIERRRARELEEELRNRHAVVEEVLELQGKLLMTLVEAAEGHQKQVARSTYEGRIAAPFVDSTEPMACPPLWLADREAALLATPVRARLDLAIEATRTLRDAWKKLVSGELGPLDLPLLSNAVRDALDGPVGIPPSPPPSYWHCPPSPPSP
ncbi:MAG: hypothetical protein AAGF23_18745 [Acidobacteriota bacterium]